MATWKTTDIKDDTKIWFGKHKGKKMREIPDSYFEYLLKNDICFRGIKHYAKTIRRIDI